MRFPATFRAAAFLMTATQLAYPVAAQDKGLAPPTRLWAAQTDPTTITLVWQGVPGAVQYLLFGPKSKKGDAGATIQQLATLGRNAARYVALVAGPGLSHQFSIQAVDAKGQVSDKVEFNAVIPQAKQATSTTVQPPPSVTASETGSGEVRVTWRAVPGATGYFIGRSVAPGGFKSLCPLCPTETNYLDTAGTAGAKHIYTVAAITPFGTSQRTRSNEVTPTVGKTGVAGADAPPKGLSDVKATVVSPTSVQLTWQPVTGYTSFRIKRRVGLTPSQVIATLAGTVFSFLDHFASGSLGGGISYEIEAIDAKGSGQKATVAIAPEKAATDSAVSTPAPKGPTGLKAAVVSPTSVRLTWEPVTGYTSFRIKRRVGLTPSQVIATLAGTVFSFLDHFTSGSLGGGISYEIEAIDAKGSAQKATVAIAPEKAATDSAVPTPSPKGLSDLKAAVVSPTSVRLSWLPGSGFTSFRINRRVGSMAAQLIATVAGTVSSFLDHLPANSLGGGIRYEVEAVDAKGSSTKATVAIAPGEKTGDPTDTGEGGGVSGSGEAPAAEAPPEPPSDLKAAVTAPNTVTLTWAPGRGLIQISRGLAGAARGVIAVVSSTVGYFVDRLPAVAKSQSFVYAIRAASTPLGAPLTNPDKAASATVTVTIDPAKAATERLPEAAPPDPGAPEEIEIESLPRPRGRP